jgi:type IV secretion system protein VirB1
MIALLGLFHMSMLAVILGGADLNTLVQRCASNVGPITMKAIIAVESSGDSYAINDDTAQHSYSPKTLTEATTIAADLMARGHNFDAGIAQVNSVNFQNEGLGLGNMFEPCWNVRAGSRILGRSYAAATKRLWIGHTPKTVEEQHLQEQLALRHAFSIYNSGSAYKSMHYSDLVVAAATHELQYRQPTVAQAYSYEPSPNTLSAKSIHIINTQPVQFAIAHKATSPTSPHLAGISVVRHISLAALAKLANGSDLYPKSVSK